MEITEELRGRWLGLRDIHRHIDWEKQCSEFQVLIDQLLSELMKWDGKLQEWREQGIEGESSAIRVKIPEQQRKLGKAWERLAELQEHEPPVVMTDGERQEFLEDLGALCALPSVRSVAIDVEGRITVTIGPVITRIPDGRFDLCDYALGIGTQIGSFNHISVQNIKRDPNDPIVAHPYNTDAVGSFCFGARISQLVTLANRGAYREFFQLAIECVHHVNPGDEAKVLGHFRRVGDA